MPVVIILFALLWASSRYFPGTGGTIMAWIGGIGTIGFTLVWFYVLYVDGKAEGEKNREQKRLAEEHDRWEQEFYKDDYPFNKPRSKSYATVEEYSAAVAEWRERIRKSGEYRERADTLSLVLMHRNSHRNRISGCYICGGPNNYIDENRLGGYGSQARCTACSRKVEDELRKLNLSAEVLSDREQLGIMRASIDQRLATAYDFNDGIISEECAKLDMAAAEKCISAEIQKLLDKRMRMARSAEAKRIKAESEREAAEEVMERLLK